MIGIFITGDEGHVGLKIVRVILKAVRFLKRGNTTKFVSLGKGNYYPLEVRRRVDLYVA
jgi:hypothetical protein